MQRMISLNAIRGIGGKTVERLEAAGIDSAEELANIDVETLEGVGISEKNAKKFITRASEKTITIHSSADRQAKYDSRESVSTGIPALDDMIGGGFEEEALIAGYGKSGVGKSQIAFYAMVNAVEQTGDPAVYIETEKDRFQPKRLKQLANDKSVVEDIHVVEAYTLEDQYNAYGRIAEAFDTLSLLVVDSFTARFRLTEQFEGRQNLGKRANEFHKHLNKLEDVSESLSCPVYLSCQASSNPDQYGRSTFIYGSAAFAHMASYFLYLSPSAGDLRSIALENHPAKPESEIQINITESDIIGLVD